MENGGDGCNSARVRLLSAGREKNGDICHVYAASMRDSQLNAEACCSPNLIIVEYEFYNS